MTGRLCLFCRCGFCALGKTCQQCLVRNEALYSLAIGLCYYVVAELKRKQTQLLVNLFQTLFIVLRQISSVVRKSLVGLRYQSHLLGVQTQLLTLVVNGFHTLEKGVVQNNTVAQFTQHRAYLLGNGVHLIIAVCLQYIEENTRHAI